jgi:hypothetical protein
MKLKLRIKKALFAFFQDEILKNVGYDGKVTELSIVSKEMNFVEIKAEIMLEDLSTELLRSGVPADIAYQKALENAKRRIFEQAMNHVIIDKNSVIDDRIYRHMAIKVSLFVGDLKTN